MNVWLAIVIILTSPFWMLLGIVIIAGIVEVINNFLKLFRRKSK